MTCAGKAKGWHLSHVRGGGWIQSGGWQLELNEMRSAVSPLPILGLQPVLDRLDSPTRFRPDRGSSRSAAPLLLQDRGEWRDGRTHFQGSASRRGRPRRT